MLKFSGGATRKSENAKIWNKNRLFQEVIRLRRLASLVATKILVFIEEIAV